MENDATTHLVPGSPEWEDRLGRLLIEERKHPERWWYVSFTSKDDELVGSVILKSCGFLSALLKAGQLGISPPGAPRSVEIPDPGGLPIDTFISKEDLKRLQQ